MIINPHSARALRPTLVESPEARQELLKEANGLKKIPMTSRESSDLLMMGIGAFTPITGFMGKEDWREVCERMWSDRYDCFWPIPITLSANADLAKNIKEGETAALWDVETDTILGMIQVSEVYPHNKEFECGHVYKTLDLAHPGVAKVMGQGPYNIAGEVKVLSESYYPEMFPGVYQTPQHAREVFTKRGWATVAALQLRNPMHNSHMYLAWIAMEICDGVYIHQLIGKLKDDDIPAHVRVKAVDALVTNYLRKERVYQGGYPLEMRYAGPREALLHAVFRQNYGCSHMIIGRDHAGVGKYYGPFDAQKIFQEIPSNVLEIRPLPLDWTFYCYKCQSMASMKTCPHEEPAQIDEDGKYVSGARLLLSGTLLRRLLAEHKNVPTEFTKPEVVHILQEYYDSLT